MVTSQITKDQVFTLINQLSFDEQQEILEYLIQKKHDAMDDTPDEIVIEGIREGVREAMSGRTIPLSQMWEGIDSESNSDPQSSEHPINQLSGKIKAFQNVNAVAWQQKIRGIGNG